VLGLKPASPDEEGKIIK